MFVNVTAMSLTLKSRATTSARSIRGSGMHHSVRAEPPARNSRLRTSPKRRELEGHSRTLPQAAALRPATTRDAEVYFRPRTAGERSETVGEPATSLTDGAE